jgi:hypothetical protein
LHNALFVALGVYRGLWLWAVVANLSAGLLLARAFSEPLQIRWGLVSGLALFGLEPYFYNASWFCAFYLAALIVYLNTEHRNHPLVQRLRELILLLSRATAGTLGLAFILIYVWAAATFLSDKSLGSPYTAVAQELNKLFVLIAVCIYVSGMRRFAMGLVTAALSFAVVQFDSRSAWSRFIDDRAPPPEDVMEIVNRSKNIYWEDGVELLWFDLQRPSYFSCLQGSGVAFYEGTAREYSKRGRVLATLNSSDFSDRMGKMCIRKSDARFKGPEVRDQLADACQGLPELDLIVLVTDVPSTPRAEWTLPVSIYSLAKMNSGFTIERHDHFYFYECKNFR